MSHQEQEFNQKEAIEVLTKIKKALYEHKQEKGLSVSSEGADLSVPPAQADILTNLTERLQTMTKSYTLGLNDSQSDFFEYLEFLNINFFFDRPLEAHEDPPHKTKFFKQTIKNVIFPIVRNSLTTIFERQRAFNSELVKFLNRLAEVLGNQRDYNMDIIKFCERVIDQYYLMEKMERRLDDFFSYLTRVSLLEEDMEVLKEKVRNLERKLSKEED